MGYQRFVTFRAVYIAAEEGRLSIAHHCDSRRANKSIEDALTGLAERERRLLELRFVHELTQAQIGKQLGVSQMQVSRPLRSTLAKLRERIGESATT